MERVCRPGIEAESGREDIRAEAGVDAEMEGIDFGAFTTAEGARGPGQAAVADTQSRNAAQASECDVPEFDARRQARCPCVPCGRGAVAIDRCVEPEDTAEEGEP